MPSLITVDVSDALAVQSLGNLLSDDAEVGLMIVVTDPSCQDAHSVRIHNATFSLSYSSQCQEGADDPITGESFDGTTYIGTQINNLKGSDVATDPEAHYE